MSPSSVSGHRAAISAVQYPTPSSPAPCLRYHGGASWAAAPVARVPRAPPAAPPLADRRPSCPVPWRPAGWRNVPSVPPRRSSRLKGGQWQRPCPRARATSSASCAALCTEGSAGRAMRAVLRKRTAEVAASSASGRLAGAAKVRARGKGAARRGAREQERKGERERGGEGRRGAPLRRPLGPTQHD
eukprot:scaffold243552_cov32-Tisochrysis_lutea.AAC.6